MQKTIEVMHREIAWALIELRKRRKWGQAELARQIAIRARYAGSILHPHQNTISEWETGRHAPSPACRQVLARIAESHKRTDHLSLVFICWRHLVHVHDLPWAQDDESQWPLRTRGRCGRMTTCETEEPGQ